jgi:hypothetical protein
VKIISSYFGNRILKHIASDMKQLAREGFTGVVHTLTENDLKYYAKSFQDIVSVSHDAGLDVDIDPWGVGMVFGGEAFSNWIAENPDQMQVSRDNCPKPLACLNSEKFRSFMHQWIDCAKDSGAEGLFWDEPHLYIPRKNDPENSWTCTCPKCRELFREKFGHDFPNSFSDEVIEFQGWTIKSFLQEMLLRGRNAGMRNTVCILPKEFVRHDPLKWEEVAGLEGVDIISTDPYWLISGSDVVSFVKSYSRLIKQLADSNGIEPQIWIQGFRVPSGREHELKTAIETVYSEGIRNLAIWGFEACGQMSFLACDNPDLVWETAVKAFRDVTKKPGSDG